MNESIRFFFGHILSRIGGFRSCVDACLNLVTGNHIVGLTAMVGGLSVPTAKKGYNLLSLRLPAFRHRWPGHFVCTTACTFHIASFYVLVRGHSFLVPEWDMQTCRCWDDVSCTLLVYRNLDRHILVHAICHIALLFYIDQVDVEDISSHLAFQSVLLRWVMTSCTYVDAPRRTHWTHALVTTLSFVVFIFSWWWFTGSISGPCVGS